MPTRAKNEPVLPALVDADAAVVREILVRHGDVVPGVPIEPKPRAGEQRVAGVVEALPQDPRRVGLVPHHQVAVVEENRDGGGGPSPGTGDHRRLAPASLMYRLLPKTWRDAPGRSVMTILSPTQNLGLVLGISLNRTPRKW
jgi:hypothetical protein